MLLRAITFAVALSALTCCWTAHPSYAQAKAHSPGQDSLVEGVQLPCLVMTAAGKTVLMPGMAESEQDLIKRFGAKNVKRQTVHLVEGETTSGTILFPDLPKQRLTIIWKNAAKRNVVDVIRLEDQPSLWHLREGITTGTTLTALEKLNGKAFKMSGFDWDYGGSVLTWEGGKLQTSLQSKTGKFRASITLAPPAGRNNSDELSGDREFLSNNPGMSKLNPVVSVLSILAP